MDRILLVEDHPAMRELVARELARAGIAADAVGRVGEAEACLAQARYGALVLDRGLPDGDARRNSAVAPNRFFISMCKARSRNPPMPVCRGFSTSAAN
jgi:DNA-binding response OmpR family regulator